LLIDMPSGEYWASDSVQPDVRSVVDVLYHVYGKPAYFRGTVRRRQNTEQGLALTIAFRKFAVFLIWKLVPGQLTEDRFVTLLVSSVTNRRPY
jgi:hypothetical protein